MPELTEKIRSMAAQLGFTRLGIANATLPLDRDFQQYERFLEAGKHGSMSYLAEHREVRRRLDSTEILEGARSVICLADAHAGAPVRLRPGGVIARYAVGRDYHNHLRKRLRKLARFVAELVPGAAARALVDTAPVLERAWAARSGLGFVGKNGLIIVPGVGSFVLLGEIVTTLDLPQGTPIGERCGSCTACLDACPTGAFDAPFVLDPRRCVAYFTIEHRGEAPEAFREKIGDRVFGCDDCQSVCPYNRAASDGVDPAYEPLPVWGERTLAELATCDEGTFDRVLAGSPVRRARQSGFARNAATVLGNLGGSHAAELLRTLRGEHADPAVHSHAAWALERCESTRTGGGA